MSDQATNEGTEMSADEGSELHGCPLVDSRGQEVLHVPRDRYTEVLRALTDEGYAMCVDLTAVDYSRFMDRDLPAGIEPERFEVVVNLLDISNRRRLRVRVQVPESDPVVPTLFDLHPGTEAMEREVYDMFGISFSDHPDPSRILMPEDWIGHPLRKDYETGSIPVQFKGAPT
ncbi:MAG: NADH-quinone oxidoreductase subunit C [Ilumatobacter sp.]